MESSSKRAKTIEVVLVLYNETYITKDLALSILMRVDVRDALHFYIASYKEEKYEKIIEQMNGNLIWMLWTKRDMDVIFRPEWNVNTVLWETVDKPKWKVYYLWLRLYMLCMQNAFIIKDHPVELRRTPSNSDKFIDIKKSRLNFLVFYKYVLEWTGQKKVFIEHDVRNFKDYEPKLWYHIFSNRFDGELDLETYGSHDFAFFRQYVYLRLRIKVFDERVKLIYAIFQYLRLVCMGTSGIDIESLYLFPRYGSKGYITVANCVSCGDKAFKKERTNPEMIFCDIECQTLFYRNKNFKK